MGYTLPTLTISPEKRDEKKMREERREEKWRKRGEKMIRIFDIVQTFTRTHTLEIPSHPPHNILLIALFIITSLFFFSLFPFFVSFFVLLDS